MKYYIITNSEVIYTPNDVYDGASVKSVGTSEEYPDITVGYWLDENYDVIDIDADEATEETHSRTEFLFEEVDEFKYSLAKVIIETYDRL